MGSQMPLEEPHLPAGVTVRQVEWEDGRRYSEIRYARAGQATQLTM